MKNTTRTRKPGLLENRKSSTKELLIDVGERLLGQHGFDGISLREIAAAAGQANTNAVQYHFKDKAGLVSAILEDRVLRIEQVRCAQLAMLDDDRVVPRQLLKVMWLPLMTIQDENGHHSFCRFMLQYLLYRGLAQHPLAPFYHFPLTPDTEDQGLFPCGKKTAQLLMSLHPDLPQPLIYKRISSLARMFLASVIEHDNALASGITDAEYDIRPILDMAVAALAAPAVDYPDQK